MRYSPTGAPTFLENGAMDSASVRLYFDHLYRIDPLRAICRRSRMPMVVTLQDLRERSVADARYTLELFRSAFIFDELAMLLPIPGGATIAACCERREVRFNARDRERAENLLPLVSALHRLHVERSFAAATSGGERNVLGREVAYLVLDAAGRRMHQSDTWGELEGAGGAVADLVARTRDEPEGEVEIGNRAAHWEVLPPDFGLAPGGRIITIEPRIPDGTSFSLDRSVDCFRSRWALTDREVDIVRLIVLGHGNAAIAERLGIGVGTVKNHRYRLYGKLDITTERELFSMFLNDVFPAPGPA